MRPCSPQSPNKHVCYCVVLPVRTAQVPSEELNVAFGRKLADKGQRSRGSRWAGLKAQLGPLADRHHTSLKPHLNDVTEHSSPFYQATRCAPLCQAHSCPPGLRTGPPRPGMQFYSHPRSKQLLTLQASAPIHLLCEAFPPTPSCSYQVPGPVLSKCLAHPPTCTYHPIF